MRAGMPGTMMDDGLTGSRLQGGGDVLYLMDGPPASQQAVDGGEWLTQGLLRHCPGLRVGTGTGQGPAPKGKPGQRSSSGRSLRGGGGQWGNMWSSAPCTGRIVLLSSTPYEVQRPSTRQPSELDVCVGQYKMAAGLECSGTAHAAILGRRRRTQRRDLAEPQGPGCLRWGMDVPCRPTRPWEMPFLEGAAMG